MPLESAQFGIRWARGSLALTTLQLSEGYFELAPKIFQLFKLRLCTVSFSLYLFIIRHRQQWLKINIGSLYYTLNLKQYRQYCMPLDYRVVVI